MKKQTFLRTTLLHFHQEHAGASRVKNEGLYGLISQRLRPYQQRELEAILKRDHFRFEKRYVYLPSTADGWQPVMVLRADFRDEKDDVAARVAIFSLMEDNQPCAAGFRFEGPEGPGVHNYYHLQPIRELDDATQLPGPPDWLPERFPAVPIDARSSVSLLACVFVGLYGWSEAAKHFLGLPGLDDLVNTEFKAMAAYNVNQLS